MAAEENQTVISLPAASDQSANQYKGVKVDSAGRFALAGEGDEAIGILQDDPAAIDRAGKICIGGVSKVWCNATLAIGARFSFDSGGKAVSVGSGDDWSMGVMLSAGAAGSLATALVQPVGKYVT